MKWERTESEGGATAIRFSRDLGCLYCKQALTQHRQTENVKGFLMDSRIRVARFIKLSPPNIRSISRTVNFRLAKTRHRSTLAISLNASYDCCKQERIGQLARRYRRTRKLRPKARLRTVMTVLNRILLSWPTEPFFSYTLRVMIVRATKTAVKSNRQNCSLRSCHDWAPGLKVFE